MEEFKKYNVLYKGAIVPASYHVNHYDYRVWKLEGAYRGSVADNNVIVLPSL